MKNRIAVAFIIVAFLVAIFVLNTTFHFCSDDCTYGLAWTSDVCDTLGATECRPHLTTIRNAWIENMADGYRPVPHIFVRIFTGCFKKTVFDVCNTLMMGFFVLILYRLTTGSFRLEWKRVALMLSMVFLVLCKGESYLWCSGSLNYLWMGTLSLLFLVVRENVEDGMVGKWARGAFPLYVLIALFAGYSQEAFALPIGFAIAACYLPRLKTLTATKMVFYSAFAVGVIALVISTCGRVESIEKPSFLGIIVNMIKVLVAIKAFWIVIVAMLFKKDRLNFVKDNLFEFLIILGSVLMIFAVGFNGERSLWAANMVSIVLALKMINPPRGVSVALASILLIILFHCVSLGLKIDSSFTAYERLYMESKDGVTCHERVPCGLFSRFFHQSIATWSHGGEVIGRNDPMNGHGASFAHYHERTIVPLALSSNLYHNLYLSDRYTVEENKLPINGDFYTSQDENTIVFPIGADIQIPKHCSVSYSFPSGIFAKIRREINSRKSPPVAWGNRPVLLTTSHGRYLLIGKEYGSDKYIRSIEFMD